MPSKSKSKCTASASGPSGPRAPLTVPMSERQQLALVMQMTSQENPSPPPNTTGERKRNKQRNERGETPLHVAAIKGDHQRVKELLDQGQDPNVSDFAGWTPLREACSYGWYQVVEVLVDGGADVNEKGIDDVTPLHDASTSGNLNMVKFLVERGADPFIKDSQGKAPSDYAAPHIQAYLQSLGDINTRAPSINTGQARDDNTKKSVASSSSGEGKQSSMDSLAQGDQFDGKDAAHSAPPSEVISTSEPNDDSHNQLSSGVVSSSQDETVAVSNKRPFEPESNESEAGDDDGSKKKKKKENDSEVETLVKPAQVARGNSGRILTGTKPPGPASKTGATPLKNMTGQGVSKANVGTLPNKTNVQTQGKNTSCSANKLAQVPGKSSTATKGTTLSTQLKTDRKSPVPSPKPSQAKDAEETEDPKTQESSAPKVPPLKIVIPGGACGSSGRSGETEGEGSSGQRGGGKGRNSSSTLPYIIPCTSSDTGPASDSSDGNSDDKKPLGDGKAAQRVLRSHRTTDDKEKDRTSPHTTTAATVGQTTVFTTSKSPPSLGQDNEHPVSTSASTSTSSSKSDSVQSSVELHPRKRKMKKEDRAQKETHSREPKSDPLVTPDATITHSNPYQMYIHIKKQIDRRQRSLFPVKPKPPKDFNNYLMNRCTYTLEGNVEAEPKVDPPASLPPLMLDEYISQEHERHGMRIQHQVEKEKLVLAVEQEILRVHGRAERAVANQPLPFSVCTILRDKEVYNVLAPEQDEKRNAQRSRCNGRQINSWLQEVDDKWEKIKEGMLKRQHTEAGALHAGQALRWEWKLREVGLCDHKRAPATPVAPAALDAAHVPIVHVSNFDLPV